MVYYMSYIIMSPGRYASVPYFFEKTYENLYSLEELCFCLVENVDLLDNDIVSDGLPRWLDEQCGLPKLAHALFALVNQKGSVSAYVGMILEYAGIYPAEEISRIEKTLRDSAGLNPYEKQKAKADYMLQNKRYTVALDRYEELLSRIPEEEAVLRGKVLHNKGVVNARLFLFERAQENFLEAYRMNGSFESLKQYLLARRMQDKDNDYVDYIAKHPNFHEASLQVERMVEQAAGQFDMTQEHRMIFTLRVFKEEGSSTAGSSAPYYDEIERLTSLLKDAYRESMAR